MVLKNIIIVASYKKCQFQPLKEYIPLTIKDCSSVSVHHFTINNTERYAIALVAINIMGNSFFNHVTLYSGEMHLFYNKVHTDREHHKLTINNITVETMKLEMLQTTYRVTVKMINSQVKHNISTYKPFIHVEELGKNEMFISNCKFFSNFYTNKLFLIASTVNGSIQFNNCQFTNNKLLSLFIKKDIGEPDQAALIKIYNSVDVEFSNCTFQDICSDDHIIQTYGKGMNPMNLVIRNTEYVNITTTEYMSLFRLIPGNVSFIFLSHTTLILEDSVIFHNMTTVGSIVSIIGNSTVIISGKVNFSYNHVNATVDICGNTIQYIMMNDNSTLEYSHNEFYELSPIAANIPTIYPHPYCFFQYFSSSTREDSLEEGKFLITLSKNSCYDCFANIPTSNCLWLKNSLFISIIPPEVNNHYIQFINNSGTYKLSQIMEQSSLCVCTDESHYDCHINDLGYLYPGQTLTVSLYHNISGTVNAVAVKSDIIQQNLPSCTVLDINENLQYINKKCTMLHYTIGFPTDTWCELLLRIASDTDEYLNVFYIKQNTCPAGFVKLNKTCQCDPVFIQYGITNCNINDQTILRPANSWITATTHNNSYTYHISLHCPLHYCLLYTTHLKLSNPNSQCQFNRSGLLCGHCKLGLSAAIFSSSYCQLCSNIYLYLTIPIVIAGVVLVLLLFVLNLTVTDGTINGFILYVNIISINTPVFFNKLDHFTPTYTFISLANLDLGIQTCFYNGMDDYAKMWLQLAFPFYLIFIATLIIITSRYSTTIQRLTACRALPVLATLFLLSYTKILRIVSSVLFFYSTITHLPSKHTTLVWSVDANVPLFGVRFTILFTVCLILFLMLIPFNVILLFTRTLSRFRYINKFKPLLDAYQGPYKDKFYFWTGFQLMIRSVLFGISSLDRNTNVAISIIVFSAIIGLHGTIRPFKIQYKNDQELLLFLNLQVLYVISLYNQGVTNNTITNTVITMAAVHFTIIIIYHIITYMCGGVIRSRMQLMSKALTRWIIRLHQKSQPQQFQLQDGIRNNIPEVAFNYHDYREPLVGLEN